MENHEFDNWEFEANGHIHAYDKRKAVEKATDKILREERKHMDNDEMREVEPWMNFWLFNFLR